MKILLVEDHPELAEWVAKSLRQDGYAVDTADCGNHAEHYLLTGDYDGVLLDPHGQPVPGMYAVGPPRKGVLWESTAIPEIRAQAAVVARAQLAVAAG